VDVADGAEVGVGLEDVEPQAAKAVTAAVAITVSMVLLSFVGICGVSPET
jgi:hypothetical protein